MPTLAHRIALAPTPAQAAAFGQYAGCARFVYNFALGCWRDWWAEYRRAERAGRAEAMERPSLAALKTTFNAMRAELFPWMADAAHCGCWLQPFADLQRALGNRRAGLTDSVKFKSKRGSRPSFYITNQKLKLDGKRVKIPKLGWVKMREALRFQGKIMGARVTKDSDGRWYISIQVEGDFSRRRTANKVLGIDLGITHAATLSDGRTFDAPKPLKAALKKLRRAQRVMCRRKKGSGRRAKAVARVGRIYARIKHVRAHFTHTTTTSILRESQAVVIEDLNVAGMMANERLARALADVGLGEFTRQVKYKAELYGTRVVVADRWYPSTKTCSGCGAVQDMSLSQRTYTCPGCGLVLDRDLNAARNLEGLVRPKRPEPSAGETSPTTRVETGVSWSMKREESPLTVQKCCE